MARSITTSHLALCLVLALLCLQASSVDGAPRGGGFRGGGFSRGGSRGGGGGGFFFVGGGGGGGGLGIVGIIFIIIAIISICICLCKCLAACCEDDDDDYNPDRIKTERHGDGYYTEGSYPCYLCEERVGEGAWNDGSHRKRCRAANPDFFERLPGLYGLTCPRCGEGLKVWPERGAEFMCEEQTCPNQGRSIVNLGSNRVNCFVCDYDICRPCAERRHDFQQAGQNPFYPGGFASPPPPHPKTDEMNFETAASAPPPPYHEAQQQQAGDVGLKVPL